MSNFLNSCCTDLLQNIRHFVCLCDGHTITWINSAGLKLLGANEINNVLGRPLADFIADDFAELFTDGLELLGAESAWVPLNILTVTAGKRDVRMHVTPLGDESDDRAYLVECQDISNLVSASKDARSREQRINAILRTVDQAVITTDEFGLIKTVNDVAERIFGHERTAMIGQNVSMLMPMPHSERHPDYMVRYLTEGTPKILDETRELEAVRADGSVFPIEIAVTEQHEGDGRRIFIGSIRDITIRKAQEDRIRFLALNDPLTGLPNRASFNDEIKSAISRARRSGKGVALMFIDLDRFKPINDTYGHDAGDLVLKTVAERVTDIIRTTDTAARLGGDEFVVILEDVAEKENAATIATNLLEKIPAPINYQGQDCSVGLSIGISHFPTDADSVEDLLNAADRAMYNVKEAGRNNYAFA